MKQRALAVGFDYVLRALFGVVLALPLAASVAATGITHFPAGDRLLFEPGGLLLVDATRALFAELVPLANAGVVVAFVLMLVMLLPYGVVLSACAPGAPRAGAEVWGRACACLPSLLSLKGLTLAAQALALLFTATVSAPVRAAMAGETSRRADLAALVAGLVGLALVLGLGLLRDLASAAAVQGGIGSRPALVTALEVLVRTPGAALRPASLAALGAGAAVSGAALVAGALDVSRPGAFRVVLVFAVHQAALLALSVCRAYWLGRALGLVDAQLTGSVARR